MPVPFRPGPWLLLLGISAAFIFALSLARLPAAPLLGAITGGVVLSLRGADMQVPRPLFMAAQSLLGGMMAMAFPLGAFRNMLASWPIILVMVLTVLSFSFLLGCLFTLRGSLPGTTALWGFWPGAATVMTVMSEAYGADMRLVAVMQYTRVLLVTLAASLFALLIGAGTGEAAFALSPDRLFTPCDPLALGATLLLVLGCTCLGLLLRLSTGPMLLTMGLGIVLHAAGWLTLVLPGWLLLICYALLGWSIGLRFTRPAVLYALRLLPSIVRSIVLLITLCALLAGAVSVISGRDFISVYLAASPGGADVAAIIALSSQADMPFVMSTQMTRFLLILLIGPRLARFTAARLKKRMDDTPPACQP